MGRIVSTFQSSFAARIFAGFVCAAAALAMIGELTTGDIGWVSAFDETFGAAARQIASPWLTDALRVVTKLGSTLVLTIVGTIAIAAFIFLGWRREILLFLLAMAGQIILHQTFKALFQRPRPQTFFDYVVGDSYSFPSGHALASLCVYGILAWSVTRRLHSAYVKSAIWFVVTILILLIGFSRIYFGLHNATDVIAGYLAAFIWTAAVASGDLPKRRS